MITVFPQSFKDFFSQITEIFVIDKYAGLEGDQRGEAPKDALPLAALINRRD